MDIKQEIKMNEEIEELRRIVLEVKVNAVRNLNVLRKAEEILGINSSTRSTSKSQDKNIKLSPLDSSHNHTTK